MSWFEEHIDRALSDLSSARLLRTPRVIEGVRGPFVTIDGREVLSFCSNDYLGLSQIDRFEAALQRGARAYGWGSGSSRLMAGTTASHRKLERELASFLGTESARGLSSRSAANAGLLPTLTDSETLVLSDERNHASVVDACRLSKAKVRVYSHGDAAAAERFLAEDASPRKLIFTDTVF